MEEGPYRATSPVAEPAGTPRHAELDVAVALLPLFGALLCRLAVVVSRGERLGREPTVVLLALAIVTLVLSGAACEALRGRIKKS